MDPNEGDVNPFPDLGFIGSASDRFSPSHSLSQLNNGSQSSKPTRQDQNHLSMTFPYEFQQQQRQLRRSDPSTPTRPFFNPDDLLISPNQHINTSSQPPSERATPELRKRLFVPNDPLISAPNTSSKPPLSKQQSTPRIDSPALPDESVHYQHDSELNFSPAYSPGEMIPNTIELTQSLRKKTPAMLKINPRAFSNVIVPQSSNRFISVSAQPTTIPFTPVTEHKAKCNCKASRCLKLYCPCFANSGFCGEGCTCKNCQNMRNTANVVHSARETVLARDPRAFEPKVRNSLASATGTDVYTKGCNCRKGCGKNYCVCRELGVDCGPRCTCSGPNGCLNKKLQIHHNQLNNLTLTDSMEKIGASSANPGDQFPGQLTDYDVKSNEHQRHSRQLKRDKVTHLPFAGSNTVNMSEQVVQRAEIPLCHVDGKSNFDQSGGDLSKRIGSNGNISPSPSLHITDSHRPTPLIRRVMSTTRQGERKLQVHLQESHSKARTMVNDVYPVKRRISLDDRPDITNSVVPISGKADPVESIQQDDTRRQLFCEAKLSGSCKREPMKESNANQEESGVPSQSSPRKRFKSKEGDASAEPTETANFLQEDKSDLCRMPRILRVKMGTGGMLRKTGAR